MKGVIIGWRGNKSSEERKGGMQEMCDLFQSVIRCKWELAGIATLGVEGRLVVMLGVLLLLPQGLLVP
jgi:hypothetical protein